MCLLRHGTRDTAPRHWHLELVKNAKRTTNERIDSLWTTINHPVIEFLGLPREERPNCNTKIFIFYKILIV